MTTLLERMPGSGRWLLELLFTWLALAVIGYWPTRMWGGPEAVRSMWAAQLIVVLIVTATSWRAGCIMPKANASGRLKIAFSIACGRFLLTLALAGVCFWQGDFEPRSFMIWLALAYLVMIKIQTIILIRWTRMFEIG